MVVRCGTIHQPYAADPSSRGLLWQRLERKPRGGRELTDAVAPNASKLGAELAKEPLANELYAGEPDAIGIAFTREKWDALCQRAVCKHARLTPANADSAQHPRALPSHPFCSLTHR